MTLKGCGICTSVVQVRGPNAKQSAPRNSSSRSGGLRFAASAAARKAVGGTQPCDRNYRGGGVTRRLGVMDAVSPGPHGVVWLILTASAGDPVIPTPSTRKRSWPFFHFPFLRPEENTATSARASLHSCYSVLTWAAPPGAAAHNTSHQRRVTLGRGDKRQKG